MNGRFREIVKIWEILLGSQIMSQTRGNMAFFFRIFFGCYAIDQDTLSGSS